MVNFFKRITKLFSSEDESRFITFWAECGKCREIVKVLVNLETDLINLYKDSRETGPAYRLRKEVLGKNCPNLMGLDVEFDQKHNVLSTKVKHGLLIDYKSGKL
jgi:hypothetical protein